MKFKRECRLCKEIFQPVGKYQKICCNCYGTKITIKGKMLELIMKTKKLEDKHGRKV